MKKKLSLLSTLVMFASLSVVGQNSKLMNTSGRIDIQQQESVYIGSDKTVTDTPQKMKSAATLPYKYSFEQTTLATVVSADGWAYTDADSKVGVTNSTSYGMVPDGTYWAYSNPNSSAARDAWFFSPGLTLSAGTTYYVSVFVYAPGYGSVVDEFKLTAGSNQTKANQTTIILDKTGTNASTYSSWTRVTGTFTPTADGTYYFGINHCTSVAGGNLVGFDAFTVQAGSAYPMPPNVKLYNIGGLWSNSVSGKVYLSPNEAIGYGEASLFTTSIAWTFPDNATPGSSTDASVSVVYPTTGSHVASLLATGSEGTTSVTTTMNIVNPSSSITDFVYNLKPSDAFITNGTVGSSSSYDYGFGINRYWKKIGEKYVIPSNVTVTLNKIYLYVAAYQMTNYSANNVVISIYPVGTDGLPGATATASYTTTFAALFGTSTISSGTFKSYTLTTPLSITGSFFVVLDFSSYPNTNTSATDRLGIYRASNRFVTDNTAYVYFTSWQPFNSVLTGYNTAGDVILNLTFTDPIATGTTNTTLGNTKAFISKNELHIINGKVGNTVNVYDIAGKLVYNNVMSESSEVFTTNFKSGVYIVKTADYSGKLIVN